MNAVGQGPPIASLTRQPAQDFSTGAVVAQVTQGQGFRGKRSRQRDLRTRAIAQGDVWLELSPARLLREVLDPVEGAGGNGTLSCGHGLCDLIAEVGGQFAHDLAVELR